MEKIQVENYEKVKVEIENAIIIEDQAINRDWEIVIKQIAEV